MNIKLLFSKLNEKLFFIICGLMILYCLIKPLIIDFEYIFVIQIILLLLSILIVVSAMLSYASKDNIHKYKRNTLWTILKWIFVGYFVAYLLFQLDTLSIYFNYLMVLLFGIVLGYRLNSK